MSYITVIFLIFVGVFLVSGIGGAKTNKGTNNRSVNLLKFQYRSHVIKMANELKAPPEHPVFFIIRLLEYRDIDKISPEASDWLAERVKYFAGTYKLTGTDEMLNSIFQALKSDFRMVGGVLKKAVLVSNGGRDANLTEIDKSEFRTMLIDGSIKRLYVSIKRNEGARELMKYIYNPNTFVGTSDAEFELVMRHVDAFSAGKCTLDEAIRRITSITGEPGSYVPGVKAEKDRSKLFEPVQEHHNAEDIETEMLEYRDDAIDEMLNGLDTGFDRPTAVTLSKYIIASAMFDISDVDFEEVVSQTRNFIDGKISIQEAVAGVSAIVGKPDDDWRDCLDYSGRDEEEAFIVNNRQIEAKAAGTVRREEAPAQDILVKEAPVATAEGISAKLISYIPYISDVRFTNSIRDIADMLGRIESNPKVDEYNSCLVFILDGVTGGKLPSYMQSSAAIMVDNMKIVYSKLENRTWLDMDKEIRSLAGDMRMRGFELPEG